MIQTRLIACNTRRDLVCLARRRFGHKLAVRQERSRHGDHVRAFVNQYVFCDFGGVDPVRCNDRDRNLPH